MISNDVIIQQMKESLLAALPGRVVKVVLYGSVARGTDTIESDIDCIIVVDEIDNGIYEAVDQFAADMLLKFGAVFSIIPVKESNFDDRIYNPLYININREGVVLWQKTA